MSFSPHSLRRASTLLVSMLLLNSQLANSQTLYGSYRVRSLATSKLLSGDETHLFVASGDGTTYQNWSLQRTDMQIQGRAAYAIQNDNTGKCLEGSQNRVYLANCSGLTNQIWNVEPSDVADYYWITNVATNKQLDGNETQIYPVDRNGGNYQKWHLAPTAKRVVRAEAPPAYPQSRIGTAVSTAPPARIEAPPAPVPQDSRVYGSYTIVRDNSLYSSDRRYRLSLQSDGNLVLYQGEGQGSVAKWASGTNGKAVEKAVFQQDGNLVLYGYNGSPVWASGTNGKTAGKGRYLLVQNDGNLVIYNQFNKPVWATNTNE